MKDLVPDLPPALCHGDFWNEQLLQKEGGGIVLIDPALHYGHPEADLAMTRLYMIFPDAFYEVVRRILSSDARLEGASAPVPVQGIPFNDRPVRHGDSLRPPEGDRRPLQIEGRRIQVDSVSLSPAMTVMTTSSVTSVMVRSSDSSIRIPFTLIRAWGRGRSQGEAQGTVLRQPCQGVFPFFGIEGFR